MAALQAQDRRERNQKFAQSPDKQIPAIFDAFDRIRIINLAERTDRREEMEAELAALGLAGDPRVKFFNAIRPEDAGPFTSPGARGVFEGQKLLLSEAAQSGESILILEDDCSFQPWLKSFQPGARWDIFYGGYLAKNPDDLEHSDIQESHMMGFSARGAQLIADYLHNLKFDGIHPPIDAAYVWFRRKYPDVPTLFATPPLAYQRPSRSDIAPKLWDRLPFTRDLADNFRKVRARLAVHN